MKHSILKRDRAAPGEIEKAKMAAQLNGLDWYSVCLRGGAADDEIKLQCYWEHKAARDSEIEIIRQCSWHGYHKDCRVARQTFHYRNDRIADCEERVRANLVEYLATLDSCDGWQEEYDNAAAKEKKLLVMRGLAHEDATLPADISDRHTEAVHDTQIWGEGLKQCIARLPKK